MVVENRERWRRGSTSVTRVNHTATLGTMTRGRIDLVMCRLAQGSQPDFHSDQMWILSPAALGTTARSVDLRLQLPDRPLGKWPNWVGLAQPALDHRIRPGTHGWVRVSCYMHVNVIVVSSRNVVRVTPRAASSR